MGEKRVQLNTVPVKIEANVIMMVGTVTSVGGVEGGVRAVGDRLGVNEVENRNRAE